jgi:hypothetical protein
MSDVVGIAADAAKLAGVTDLKAVAAASSEAVESVLAPAPKSDVVDSEIKAMEKQDQTVKLIQSALSAQKSATETVQAQTAVQQVKKVEENLKASLAHADLEEAAMEAKAEKDESLTAEAARHSADAAVAQIEARASTKKKATQNAARERRNMIADETAKEATQIKANIVAGRAPASQEPFPLTTQMPDARSEGCGASSSNLLHGVETDPAKAASDSMLPLVPCWKESNASAISPAPVQTVAAQAASGSPTAVAAQQGPAAPRALTGSNESTGCGEHGPV